MCYSSFCLKNVYLLLFDEFEGRKVSKVAGTVISRIVLLLGGCGAMFLAGRWIYKRCNPITWCAQRIDIKKEQLEDEEKKEEAPVAEEEKPQVIFLLGGPGSGRSPPLSRSPCMKGHRVEHSQGEAGLDSH